MSLRTIVDAHRRRGWTQFSAVRRRITQFLPTIPAFGVPIRADTVAGRGNGIDARILHQM